MIARCAKIGAGILTVSLLAGCGFTPLYASHDSTDSVGSSLSSVNIALIPDRVGQELRQDLQQIMAADGSDGVTHYDLYVTVSMSESDIAINQQTASTRARDTGAASWVLRKEGEKHTEVAHGGAHALDGYDIINQQFFAADMSREAAYRRIDKALAEQIVQQLAVYFRQHPG